MIIFIFGLFLQPCLAEKNLQVGGSFVLYSKSYDISQDLYGKSEISFGIDCCYFLNSLFGLYLETNFYSSEGKSSHLQNPLQYSETHFMPGIKFRLNLFHFKNSKGLKLYLKCSGLIISYSEKFEDTTKGTAYGFTFGGGLAFYFNQFGVALELAKNVADKDINIEGLDIIEKVSFSGTRLALRFFFNF